MNTEIIKSIINQVETDSKDLDILLEDTTKEYVEQLDNTVLKIQKRISDSDGDLPIDDLISFISELCPIIFFVLAKLEKLGNRADLAEQYRVERYNLARQSQPGTQADKASFAESCTQDEALVADIYSRAYKSVKLRVDAAQTIIDALKKALSAKMSEYQVIRSQNNVMSN